MPRVNLDESSHLDRRAIVILTILKELPADFDVPIVVMQHLAPESSFVEVYGPRTPFQLEWARPQSPHAARKALACPPCSFVELLPCEEGALQRPIDRQRVGGELQGPALRRR